MTATHFVDTNVLVYAVDASEAAKQPIAAAWVDWLWETRSGRISFQVLSELYVALTRKLQHKMATSEARGYVQDFVAWAPVVVDTKLLQRAWALQDEASLSHWAAQIVAAAQLSDAQFLLSEDLADGQMIGTVRVLNPFNAPVPSL